MNSREPVEPSARDLRTASYWTDQHRRLQPSGNFLAHPMVQGYVSMRAFGSLVAHLEVVIAELRNRTSPGDSILSVGCGPALKERALARLLPDRTFVGIDIATDIVESTRQECARAGLANLTVRVGDFNALDLERGRFRAVLGLGALHHIERLEEFWAACAAGMTRDGSVLAQEYVGPNRMQWTPAQCHFGTEALREIVPDQHKPHHRKVVPTPLEVMDEYDPSEAVRSRDIVPTCRAAGFEIEGYAGAGCALLQPVLMEQIATYDPRDWAHNAILAKLFAEEDRLMRAGELEDDFAMFVARPPR